MQVNVDGPTLRVRQLRGVDRVRSIDLSAKRLGDASAAVVGALVGDNAFCASLNLASNPISEEGKHALGKALLRSTRCSLEGFACDAFKVPEGLHPVGKDFFDYKAFVGSIDPMERF